MRRQQNVSLQVESLEALIMPSGVTRALTLPTHVTALMSPISSTSVGTKANAHNEYAAAYSIMSLFHGQGFIGGAAGAKAYLPFAPTQVSANSKLINQPLGQARADAIARKLGLIKALCLTEEQYHTLISGNSADGKGDPTSAMLIDESVSILTNSAAHPLVRNIDGTPTEIVLGSYGVYVNTDGMLESPANSSAPTRMVNEVIKPGGYLSQWAKANGAEKSLIMLHQSAYRTQLPYGTLAQHQGGAAELALYRNGVFSKVVGLSMVPSIWEINFALIYTLNPKLAANMPAYWTALPNNVVAALLQSGTGQVPFSTFASEFHYSPTP